MKSMVPYAEHASYLRHRKQRVWQIFVPVVLAALVFIALIVLISMAAARGNTGIGQWASVSAIFIMIPLLVMGLIFIIVLFGLGWLLGKLLGILPPYTSRVQDLVYRLQAAIERFTDLVVKPFFGFDEAGATIKALFGRR